jgi:hypothetical protein
MGVGFRKEDTQEVVMEGEDKEMDKSSDLRDIFKNPVWLGLEAARRQLDALQAKVERCCDEMEKRFETLLKKRKS